jgi:hypothetical protein
VGTKVLDKEETAVPLDIQNGFNDINDDIPGKQDGIIKTEYPAVKVKAEPQSSGEKRVIEELVTPNGSRKRKSSSTLLKILNPDRQIDEPSNNDCGSLPISKKPQPTLANLLHGFNVSAMQHSIPVDTIDDDVQITHITSPTIFKKGSCSKPTLQKMLTSPYSGKSPLLSSMLKTSKNHSTPSGSRTNSTIDKVFTFSVRPIVDNKSLFSPSIFPLPDKSTFVVKLLGILSKLFSFMPELHELVESVLLRDSITTSSLATGETGPQKTDSTNVQQMAGLSQVSSLTSSLLSSLAEKVSGCSIPAKVPDNLTESKPPAVRTVILLESF